MIMVLLIFVLAATVVAILVLVMTSRSSPSEVKRDARPSDRIAADIQDRATELSGLLDRADEKIAKLDASINQPPAVATETSKESHQPHTPVVEKHIAVYDLADSGLDVYEIARRTKIGAGEIELILNLRKKR